MSNNENLINAQKAKRDEFFTPRDAVENELKQVPRFIFHRRLQVLQASQMKWSKMNLLNQNVFEVLSSGVVKML